MHILGKAAVLSAGLMIAQPANAAEWLLTFKGHVFYHVTSVAYFSPGLIGKSLTAAFRVDDAGYDLGYDPVFSQLYSFGSLSPISASVTIDGSEYSLGQLGVLAASGLSQYVGPSNTVLDIGISELRASDLFTTRSLGLSAVNDVGVLTTKDFRVEGNFVLDPQVSRGDMVYRTESVGPSGTYIAADHLMFSLHSYSVEAVQASVPEPSSWAMMVLGIGVVGAVARRRRVIAA